MIKQELQNKESSQFALGAFRIHFGLAAMRTAFDQRVCIFHARIRSQLIEQRATLLSARRLASVVSQFSPRFQHSVRDKIWITPNRTGEMQIMFARKREVSD